MTYEYKVVPAPARGLKAKGVKTAEDRFANALQTAINELADKGWDYLRTDTLPCEQREGFMGKTTVYQNMLVFRRTKQAEKLALQPPKPSVAAPSVAAPTPPVAEPTPPAPPKTGEERLAEKARLAAPRPTGIELDEAAKKKSSDLAAE